MQQNDFSESPYAPLPEDALSILRRLKVPPRLLAHLVLVHDVAAKLVVELQNAFPELKFDEERILFGAATHDIGKAIHVEELSFPGKLHEKEGEALLKGLGVPAERARFAFTHGNCQDDPNASAEDLVVALADNCWKGKRPEELETAMINVLSSETGQPAWECFAKLDEILQKLAADADNRLAWQARFPVVSNSVPARRKY